MIPTVLATYIRSIFVVFLHSLTSGRRKAWVVDVARSSQTLRRRSVTTRCWAWMTVITSNCYNTWVLPCLSNTYKDMGRYGRHWEWYWIWIIAEYVYHTRIKIVYCNQTLFNLTHAISFYSHFRPYFLLKLHHIGIILLVTAWATSLICLMCWFLAGLLVKLT